MPSIDFTTVEGLEPIEEGSYNATIVNAEVGMSKQDQPKIDLRWKIDDGQEHAGRQIFDTLSFHPEALWRTKLALQALGFANDFSGEVETEDLLNRSATIRVTIEPSTQIDPATGEPYPPRNRVTRVSPLSQTAASLLE